LERCRQEELEGCSQAELKKIGGKDKDRQALASTIDIIQKGRYYTGKQMSYRQISHRYQDTSYR
jgi:hypothetical protein